MSNTHVERNRGSPESTSRLRRRSFPVPILSLEIAELEKWVRMESRNRLRKLRADLRRIIRERKSTEETILKEHPLMAYHEDGKHFFKGTDIDG